MKSYAMIFIYGSEMRGEKELFAWQKARLHFFEDSSQPTFHILFHHRHSSQDEYGTAAYKMVELDNKLGGIAVQHREIQGLESQRFLNYFHHRITYWEGGIESGFRHVEPTEHHPHLLHIKGHIKAGTIRMTQEPCRRDAMNSGDVFVLVSGDASCWMWVGKDANNDEKVKGMEVAQSFCTKGNVVVLDEGVNDGVDEANDFWKHIQTEVSLLGSIKRQVHVQKADHNDDRGHSYIPTLFLIPPHLGEKITKVSKAHLAHTSGSPTTDDKHYQIQRSCLKQNHAYLLDTGFHVYVWMGKKTRPAIRVLAIHHAETYFNTWNRPILPVTIVKQGQETDSFRHFFTRDDEGGGCTIMWRSWEAKKLIIAGWLYRVLVRHVW